MWFIVKILWTWNLFFTLLEISKPFFFSIFGNAIITIAKKKKFYSPISAMTLPRLPFFFFFLRALYTRAHSDTQHSVGKLGSGISSIPLPKFNIFSLPPLSPTFSFSLFSLLLCILSPAFWLNFGNAIAEIQSLSSFSQLSLNSSYNAN